MSDLTLQDPHHDQHGAAMDAPKSAAVILRRDVELSAAEKQILSDFQGSMAWDQVDEFHLALREFGDQPMRPLSEIVAALELRFPLNCEIEGVKSRAKNPGALPAPSALPPLPPATPESPASGALSAEAPQAEAAAPSPEGETSEGARAEAAQEA